MKASDLSIYKGAPIFPISQSSRDELTMLALEGLTEAAPTQSVVGNSVAGRLDLNLPLPANESPNISACNTRGCFGMTAHHNG